MAVEDLSRRTAIVTGAAGGIGRKLVNAILSAGGRVFAVDLSQAGLDALHAENASRRLYSQAVDLTDESAPAQVIEATKAAFGGFDTLICNAGIGRSIYTQDILAGAPSAWDVPRWAWHKMFHVNALSAIQLSNLAIPELLQQEFGSLVFVTTSLDSMINAGTGPYGPSKAALEAYAAILADELKGRASVNVLIPGGAVDTPMIPSQGNVRRSEFLNAGVMIPPLMYLLSEEGRSVTGRRIRANLWAASEKQDQALEQASAPIAWVSIAAGQRRQIRQAL